jgi:photosystem II stability/assembly factor-like uncharacterized protein
MPMPALLVATWNDGVFAIDGDAFRQDFPGLPVASLIADDDGGVLAIVGGRSLCRRSSDGGWSVITESEKPLSCCLWSDGIIFVGTDEAEILRLDPDGALQRVPAFDIVPGREHWYAGAAIIDGKLMGPPLGIRSMTATCDGRVLLANVHVGGIPRSTDGGLGWRPTIDIHSDVHQVLAHPARPEIVIAAAAAGLCISRDAGATWTITQEGLHAPYCSAVGFAGNDIFVAASTDHFAAEGAVYRRPIDEDGPLRLAGDAIPHRIAGIVDTGCIATRDETVAIIDRSGRIYGSKDGGWSYGFDRPMMPSGLYIS